MSAILARGFVLTIALACVADAAAQPVFLQRLNSGPNAIEQGAYGYGLGSDDVRIGIGEPFGLSGGMPSIAGGALEVWRRDGNTLTREQRILPPLPVSGGIFGIRAALSGEWLAVMDISAGPQLHLYRRSGSVWTLQQTLSDPGDWGSSIALLDDMLALGSPYYTPAVGLESSGAVRLYRHQSSTWIEQPLLTGLDPSSHRTFGDSVALDRRADGVLQLAVGASGRNLAKGAVYVFHQDDSQWLHEQRLQLADGQADEHLGFSVALRGETLLAGAPQASVLAQTTAGRAVVWRRLGSPDFPWVQESVLTWAQPAQDDQFGLAVALSREDDALIAAPRRDISSGSIYVNAGAVRRFHLGRNPVTCTSTWFDAGGVGNPAALPQTGALYGATLAGGRLVAISALLGSVQSTASAGFVDAFYDDSLFDDGFECSP